MSSFCNLHDDLFVFQSPGHASTTDHDDDSNHDSEPEAGHGDGNEDEDSEGRIGFVSFNLATVEERPENAEFRLQRKDTPHFTKGKRIVQDDEQKAREILANLGAKGTSDDDSDLEGRDKEEEVCPGFYVILPNLIVLCRMQGVQSLHGQ